MLSIMRGKIISLLKKVFSQSGYSVEKSYEYDLIAEKQSDRVYVNYSEVIDQDDLENFANDTRDVDGAALLVCLAGLSSSIRDLAEQEGIIVWDKNELESQIGRAILAEIEGRMTELSFSTPKKESESFDFPSVGFMKMFGNEESEVTSVPAPETNITPFYESSVPPAFEPAVPSISEATTVIKLHTLSIDVDQSEALATAKRQIREAEISKIRFVPFWLYNYSLDSKKQYKSKIIDLSGRGTSEINALTGSISNRLTMFKDQFHDRITVPERGYMVEKPVLTREEIETAVINKILVEHTKTFKFSEEDGQVVIYEDKVFKPSRNDISLDFELIYLPVWEIKGSNGFIEINAFSGEEIDFPIDSDAEFI